MWTVPTMHGFYLYRPKPLTSGDGTTRDIKLVLELPFSQDVS